MPYIKEADRKKYDGLVAQLALVLKDSKQRAGDLNYIVSRIGVLVLGEKAKYADHNEFIGALEAIKLEWYRRMTGPYEDTKILENGDIKESSNNRPTDG